MIAVPSEIRTQYGHAIVHRNGELKLLPIVPKSVAVMPGSQQICTNANMQQYQLCNWQNKIAIRYTIRIVPTGKTGMNQTGNECAKMQQAE